MAKKKSKTLLYVSIICGAIVIIALLIFGFSTQWTFNPNKSNKKASNVGIPIQSDDDNQGITYDDLELENQELSPQEESEITISEVEKQEKSDEKQTDNFATSILKYHNEIRKKCGNTPKLKWNNEIAKYAQKWANQLKEDVNRINNGVCVVGQELIRHSPNLKPKNYGENIAYNSPDSGYDQNNRIAINGWAGEGYYPNASGSIKEPNGTPVTGHYSAMNWTTLTDIGCGQSITKDDCAITVCNYQDRTNPKNPKAPNLLSARGADKNRDFANRIKCSEPLQLS